MSSGILVHIAVLSNASKNLLVQGEVEVVGVQVVDCSAASNKDCRHAQHAANAFDTEKVALMHGIFQMLQASQGKAPWLLCPPPTPTLS